MKDKIVKIYETLGTEVYETPTIQAFLFEEDDVITTSGGEEGVETPTVPFG